MPGLVPGIHDFLIGLKTWMAGTSPDEPGHDGKVVINMHDPLNAFCAHATARLPGAPAGPLAGLTFAAKDLFDIAGHVTGAGNPDWLAHHAPAERTAPVVQTLVDAGAAMVGKTHTDELSRGIFGENAHYGTPINPSPRPMTSP